MKIEHLIPAILLFLFTLQGYSQKKISKDEAVGDAFLSIEEYAEASKFYLLAYEKDPSSVLIEKIAKTFRLRHLYRDASLWYQKLMDNTYTNPENIFYWGVSLRNDGKYKEAKIQFERYIEMDSTYESEAGLFINACDSALAWLERPFPYQVVNLEKLNSPFSEIAPSYYEAGIVFPSTRDGTLIKLKSGRTSDAFYNLYYARKKENAFREKPKLFSHFFNSSCNDGPVTFSKDFKTIYFSRSMEKVKSTKNNKVNFLKLNKSEWKEGKWQSPEKFLLNDSSFSCTHPTISSDGKLFIFSSDMPGGMGGMDLYISFKIDSGWTKPKNLGEKINTPYNEAYPFFHEEGILYFASEGHEGMGGFDLFSIELNGSEWANLKNLKPPINSYADDLSFIINFDRTSGYFSSNRAGGKGKEDLYLINFKLLVE